MTINELDVQNRPGESLHYFDGELHALLMERLPQIVVGGRIDTGRLCRATGNARYTVHRWMIEDHISPAGARSLIRVSEGRITPEDLLPFLLA